MKEVYLETILLIERLHRRFLDVIKTELDRLKIEEINNVQTLILYNINNEQITIGELTNRGYYLGSNVSYNVKDLVEKGFLIKERSPHDKRSTRVKLSEKGLALCEKIDELYKRHLEALKTGTPNLASLPEINTGLHQLEQFWTSYINNVFRGM
ncbi:MAG TPA: winged helix DNA-binding protein [Rickettsiales bacterium]|nr:winged helix DNA-binding protein [Rickettsiales bacterium]